MGIGDLTQQRGDHAAEAGGQTHGDARSQTDMVGDELLAQCDRGAEGQVEGHGGGDQHDGREGDRAGHGDDDQAGDEQGQALCLTFARFTEPKK